MEIAGANSSKYKHLDGISLLPTIQQNNTPERDEPIYGYRVYEDLCASVRSTDWTLLAYRSGTIKLYNMANDINAEHDLAATRPQKVAELKATFVEWGKEVGVANYSGVQ